ncbi:unnamed protein product [Citrullus colocynthis]|uniref:Uncharacterized protein n=1 Tax=Citrullus colocynthis TaxID=252529 RepID=A0ABP0Y0J3_9ROSI
MMMEESKGNGHEEDIKKKRYLIVSVHDQRDGGRQELGGNGNTDQRRDWFAEMEREDGGNSLARMGKRSKAKDAKETTRRSRVVDDELKKATRMGSNNDRYPRHWPKAKKTSSGANSKKEGGER